MAAAAWQLVREMFPQQNNESDASVRVRLELLGKVIAEVGEKKFIQAVKQAISISKFRYDVTVQRIRECAGLYYLPPLSPYAEAWRIATRIFLDHCRADSNGNYVLEPKYTRSGDKVVIIPVPPVPEAILRTIQALGGWESLADRSAWSYRYRDFRELYCETTGTSDPIPTK